MGSSAAALSLVLACAAGATAAAAADCTPGRVEFRGDKGPLASFTVEIADTEALRETGLMNREKMASGAGMLFVYGMPGHPYFWMKNTLIPLDMVFIDRAGRVARVHDMATPGDLTPIDGGAGVQYVLEIGGGFAARLGIAEGAEMRSDVLDPGLAAWPCP